MPGVRSVAHARDAGVKPTVPRVLSPGDDAMVMVSVAAGLTGRNARRSPGEAVNQTPARWAAAIGEVVPVERPVRLDGRPARVTPGPGRSPCRRQIRTLAGRAALDTHAIFLGGRHRESAPRSRAWFQAGIAKRLASSPGIAAAGEWVRWPDVPDSSAAE